MNSLTAPGIPQITYSADGEGRPAQVSAGAGVNPVTGTTYNVFGGPTQLSLGSGDSDSFQYDANTGRMTQYQYTVGSTPKTVTGNLGWNANGTLGTLVITDQLNTANTQTCSYAHDDLVRVAGVTCTNNPTNIWAQTFGYDPLGNLSKFLVTGYPGTSFTPTYSTSTNRITSAPFTYDANGNTLTDNVHSYAWDAEGEAVTDDSLTLTYDALGRMVEQNGSTQIVYAPTGQKFALMNGQTLVKAFVALPAGAVAVYDSSGVIAYYRHADWLGSSRLSTTPGRAVYSSLAYAPFGETYAESGTSDRSFTGQNQDTLANSTNGLYDFLYREYAQYGRWISPDPAGMGAVSIANPQSWNRYAYVANQPLILVDPLGLCPLMDNTEKLPNKGCAIVQRPGPNTVGGGYVVDGVQMPAYLNGYFDNLVDHGDAVLCGSDCNLTIAANGHIYQWLASGQPTECYTTADGGYYCPATGYSWVDVGVAANNGSWWSALKHFQAANNGTTTNNGEPVPCEDQACELARAINKTGVQALQNPCTPLAFYGLSGGVAVVGSATPVGAGLLPELGSYSVPAAAQAASIFTRFLTSGRQLATRAIAYVGGKVTSAVQSTCNALQ